MDLGQLKLAGGVHRARGGHPSKRAIDGHFRRRNNAWELFVSLAEEIPDELGWKKGKAIASLMVDEEWRMYLVDQEQMPADQFDETMQGGMVSGYGKKAGASTRTYLKLRNLKGFLADHLDAVAQRHHTNLNGVKMPIEGSTGTSRFEGEEVPHIKVRLADVYREKK